MKPKKKAMMFIAVLGNNIHENLLDDKILLLFINIRKRNIWNYYCNKEETKTKYW